MRLTTQRCASQVYEKTYHYASAPHALPHSTNQRIILSQSTLKARRKHNISLTSFLYETIEKENFKPVLSTTIATIYGQYGSCPAFTSPMLLSSSADQNKISAIEAADPPPQEGEFFISSNNFQMYASSSGVLLPLAQTG